MMDIKFSTILSNNQYKQMANAIRALTIDAIEVSKSGHPGMPLGMADFATLLFSEFIHFNPSDPRWHNRDRFVLSAGHGSMLLYSLLYLLGYKDITIEDIKNFRKFHSKTAGHPEYGMLDAIETTTGPLGQGIANAVGMAIAEKNQNAKFGDEIINNYTYVICGDGCLMEGIAQEAISLAGHLQLNKLIVIFDDNQISIDGATSLAISDDYNQKFASCNWNVINVDGHDFDQVRAALYRAKKSEKPTLIAARTIIGKYSPNKEGTEKCHGAPLGKEEALLTKQKMQWTYPEFTIPEEILDLWRSRWLKTSKQYKMWKEQNLLELEEFLENNYANIDIFSELKNEAKILVQESTRKSSQRVVAAIIKKIPNIFGGGADLAESNCTKLPDHKIFSAQNYSGNYIHYGIREHAMVAIMNGLNLYKGYIPYGGTFLVFSDYCRPAIRLAALMKLNIALIMTHDSIGVGEDGPTHQPVEHLASLRAIPNLLVFRPADLIETMESWDIVLKNKMPTILCLSRQNLPQIRNKEILEENLSMKGAYHIYDSPSAQIVLFASGSELSIAYEIYNKLISQSIEVRLVSVPCMDLFEQQSLEYKEQILGKNNLRVVMEAGIRMSWDKYLREEDLFFGVEEFGISGPANEIYNHFGLTVENIFSTIIKKLEQK